MEERDKHVTRICIGAHTNNVLWDEERRFRNGSADSGFGETVRLGKNKNKEAYELDDLKSRKTPIISPSNTENNLPERENKDTIPSFYKEEADEKYVLGCFQTIFEKLKLSHPAKAAIIFTVILALCDSITDISTAIYIYNTGFLSTFAFILATDYFGGFILLLHHLDLILKDNRSIDMCKSELMFGQGVEIIFAIFLFLIHPFSVPILGLLWNYFDEKNNDKRSRYHYLFSNAVMVRDCFESPLQILIMLSSNALGIMRLPWDDQYYTDSIGNKHNINILITVSFLLSLLSLLKGCTNYAIYKRDTTFLSLIILNIGIKMWSLFVIFLCTPEGAIVAAVLIFVSNMTIMMTSRQKLEGYSISTTSITSIFLLSVALHRPELTQISGAQERMTATHKKAELIKAMAKLSAGSFIIIFIILIFIRSYFLLNFSIDLEISYSVGQLKWMIAYFIFPVVFTGILASIGIIVWAKKTAEIEEEDVKNHSMSYKEQLVQAKNPWGERVTLLNAMAVTVLVVSIIAYNVSLLKGLIPASDTFVFGINNFDDRILIREFKVNRTIADKLEEIQNSTCFFDSSQSIFTCGEENKVELPWNKNDYIVDGHQIKIYNYKEYGNYLSTGEKDLSNFNCAACIGSYVDKNDKKTATFHRCTVTIKQFFPRFCKEYEPKLRADGKCGLEYLLIEDGSPGECSKYSEKPCCGLTNDCGTECNCVGCTDFRTGFFTSPYDKEKKSVLHKLRKQTRVLDNQAVETLRPGNSNNPRNVRLVEKIMNRQKYEELFPKAAYVYSYSNFLKAVAKFQGFCDDEDEIMCRKVLASFFAITSYRSANLAITSTPKDVDCDNWLPKYYQDYFDCQGNISYYDRGAYGLRGNYNLGRLSRAVYGDTQLLGAPERLETSWLGFGSAIWYFVNPVGYTPSMLDLITGTYELNDDDVKNNRYAAFSTLFSKVESSGYSQVGCTNKSDEIEKRATAITAYKRLVVELNVTNDDLTKLDCYELDYKFFTPSSAYNLLKMFMDHRKDCTPSQDSMPFNIFVEKDRDDCEQASKEWKCLEAERPWRCGPKVSLVKGESKKCSEEFRCCSNVHYCGNSKDYCEYGGGEVQNENVPLNDDWKQTYPFRVDECN